MNQLIRNAQYALARFPYTYLFGTIAGLAYFLQQLLPYDARSQQLEHLICAGIFAIPLSIGVVIASEHRPLSPVKKSVLQTLLVFVPTFLVLLYLEAGDGNTYAPTYAAFLVLAHLVMTYAVSFQQHWSSSSYWSFNYLLFLRFSYATIVAVVWFVGTLIILYAIQLLFHLDRSFMNHGLDACFALSAFVLHPLVFCASFPRDFNRPPELPHPRPLLLLAQYVLLPLVFLYTCVLYLYLLKCLVTGSFPQGLIAGMTVGASVAGLAALLALLPLEGDARYPWVKRINDAFYFWVLPLLVASLWSLAVRISSYGLTLSRYGLLLYCLWMLVMAVLGILRRGSFAVMHQTLFAVILLTSVGPLSLTSVTLRSQKSQLLALLRPLGMVNEKGALVHGDQVTLTPATYERARNILSFLAQNYPWHQLAPLISNNVIKDFEDNAAENYLNGWERGNDLVKAIGLHQRPTALGDARGHFFWQAVADRWKENGVTHIQSRLEATRQHVFKELRLRLVLEGLEVSVQDLDGNKRTSFKLKDYLTTDRRNEMLIIQSADGRQSVVLSELQSTEKDLLSVTGLWRLRPY